MIRRVRVPRGQRQPLDVGLPEAVAHAQIHLGGGRVVNVDRHAEVLIVGITDIGVVGLIVENAGADGGLGRGRPNAID